MARPLTDIDSVRAGLLETVETLIVERGSRAMTLTELAAAANMSPANIYRFFANKEALFEAVAERWFAPKVAVMEDVVASDAPIDQKLFAFFARRLVLTRAMYRANPQAYACYMELGDQYWEIVRGYVDLADHYLAVLIAEAMSEGFFAGLSVDDAVSLVNLMIHPFVNPNLLPDLDDRLTDEKLATIIGTMLTGLSASAAIPIGANVVPIKSAFRAASL